MTDTQMPAHQGGMPMAAGWTPFNVNLFPHRWTPYTFTIEIRGVDFSAAQFRIQVRPYPDAETPLLELGNDAPGSQGISCSVVTVGGAPSSIIVIQIDEATIEGLPFPTPRGSDPRFSWDMLIWGAGIPKRRWFQGAFIVRAGSTHV